MQVLLLKGRETPTTCQEQDVPQSRAPPTTTDNPGGVQNTPRIIIIIIISMSENQTTKGIQSTTPRSGNTLTSPSIASSTRMDENQAAKEQTQK